jgi:divalent metal cation (Fe/Co/Zn/Cd) transporter
VALLLGKDMRSADDWAALFASGFILFNAYLIFRPALGEIMDEHVHDDLIEKIRATFKSSRRIVILKMLLS